MLVHALWLEDFSINLVNKGVNCLIPTGLGVITVAHVAFALFTSLTGAVTTLAHYFATFFAKEVDQATHVGEEKGGVGIVDVGVDHLV